MSKVQKMRVLIVDDEILARNNIGELLKPHADVEVVAACEDEEEAVASIRRHAPDLVFLDMQLRGSSKGFDVLGRIEEGSRPLFIVVTGHEGYERKAFDFHAVDFLGKPLYQERFDEALSQARKWLKAGPPKGKYLGFKSQGRVFHREKDAIMWVGAEGRYMRLNFKDQSPLLEETMEGMEARLDRDKFIRIHRSYMVNLDYVKEIRHMCKQEYVVVMQDGRELPVSHSGRKRLAERLEINL
jgi:two-component system LytT family response regulator